MSFGVDVAAQRIDDLDTKLLEAVAAARTSQYQPTVLDMGCGSGGLAERLATLGARVTAVDIVDYSSAIADRNSNLTAACTPITFVQVEMSQYIKTQVSMFDFVVLQRVLHYLPYLEAVSTLRALRNRTSRLYVSVTGAESDIARGYPLLGAPLFERFGCVTPTTARRFSISAPVCLYTAAEFVALLETSGWSVEGRWTSAFGNHKAIASTSHTVPD